MKASRFSEAQKAFILKQGRDGMPVAEVCRKAGISQATYFNWKKKYDGLLPTEMRRLRQLEDENANCVVSWPISVSTRRCCRT
jgi:putative transposase